MDFRKLNNITIEDKYPIPNINSILSNLGKAMFFTTLDLKSGFYQIVMAEKDREKCAFSVNNEKYEFCRLPMGLKNAPSIFQRAIDDILRENIGKCCHVYMDDVIIYSATAEEHVEHLDWVLSLFQANMRVSSEKSHFFKDSVEFLGFVVSRGGVGTSPDKVNAILNFAEPKSLFDVRSFLGLAGYYRRLIRDFALISKPLTDILKGENGSVSASRSKKVVVKFNSEQLVLFNKLRNVVASEDVTLLHPDYDKPFDLTTDASSFRIGAVLSQGGQTEIKRWKAFVDEHNANIFYKPGKENFVADALSRQAVFVVEDNLSTIHSEESLSNTIDSMENPVNCYRNQLIREESDTDSARTLIVFGSLRRHIIQFTNNQFLLDSLRDSVCATAVIAR